jgi:hypothetical protein
MSQKEIERVQILNNVLGRCITQVKAAELLGISERQVRNLTYLLKTHGPQGLISKKRGKSSNHRMGQHIRKKTLNLIQEKYSDFGPTLISEKLQEIHQINVSREAIRQWMVQTHLWVPHVKKRKLHPLRARREYFGEMIQADGSHHDWFENGCPCVLIIFIDDATSQITAARFEKSETLEGYFQTLRQHLDRFGRPFSLYTDRFSVFESALKKENLTQFQRALRSLNIDWIGANSPQAKGRVERCNRTLQDRLVKEMRLKGITGMDEGNIFLKEFLEMHNKKFSKKPVKNADLHRPLERGVDLSRTLSKYEERTLTKDLLFQFHTRHYRIVEQENHYFPGQKIEIRTDNAGDMRVFISGKEVATKRLDQDYESNQKVIYLDDIWPTKHLKPPGANHPWKKSSHRRRVEA